MTNKEASATLVVFQEDILNNLWLSNEQRKGLAEAIDLAIKALRIADVIEDGFKRDSNLMMDSDDWKDIKAFVEKEAENEKV